MRAEIIAIGSELTTGAKLDTNSQWLSRELAGIGIPVHYHTTVADDRDANVSVMRIAADRADVVFITGGLGPTLDDLTREVLAEMAGVPLVLHQESLDIIRDMFQRRGREMPERNVIQAKFPEGSEVIPNPRGTAPGIWMELERPGRTSCKIAAMPGVPSEMKPMFRDSVLPRLETPGEGARFIRSARLNAFGLGESDAESRLGDLTARGRDPEVGITAHEATITLRIEAQGNSIAECEAKIQASRDVAYDRLGITIFGEDDDTLEEVVVRMLQEQNLTLSTAEAGSGGLVAHWITETAGYATAYLGGVVAPPNRTEHPWLDIDPATLKDGTDVNGEVAIVMGATCRDRFGSDLALAITACPREAATGDHPGTWVSLVGPFGVEVQKYTPVGDPSILKSRLAKFALNMVRLRLLRHDEEPA